jgi:hypothetical protein
MRSPARASDAIVRGAMISGRWMRCKALDGRDQFGKAEAWRPLA